MSKRGKTKRTVQASGRKTSQASQSASGPKLVLVSVVLLALIIGGFLSNRLSLTLITPAPGGNLVTPAAATSKPTRVGSISPLPPASGSSALGAAARTIVIDPGHGGSDWGAFHTDEQGQADLREKDITLQVGLKTGQLLQAAGYTVVFTRQTDTAVNITARDLNGDGATNEQDDLYARIEVANQHQADLFISIHVNSSQLGDSVGGMETWYCADRPFGKQSQVLAELIQKEGLESLKNSNDNYIAQNRGVLDDIEVNAGVGLHIATLGPPTPTRKVATTMPGVLTEILFLSNSREAALLAQEATLNQFAVGYSRAIEAYFNNV